MQERQHFEGILRAFDEYRAWGLAKIDRMEHHYAELSEEDRLVTRVAEKLAGMRQAVEQNARVLSQLCAPHRAATAAVATASSRVSESDLEKVQSTLKQFVREWGEDGAIERQAAHSPVLEALRKTLPEPTGRRVLLPGAGLGRLVWEVARLGYIAQGCEFSYFMLVASNFLLNRLGAARVSVTVHPWVLQTCNSVSAADQLRPARVPDVAPDELPASAQLSMCAGDFLEVYSGQRAAWDAVVTLFFVDTAHDVSRYLRHIWDLLVDGGVWINIGPLLWHFHDMPGEVSVELTWEELRALILSCGFVLEHEEWRRCGYTTNPASLYQMAYTCMFFVARKPVPV